jgi:hypothetical protein
MFTSSTRGRPREWESIRTHSRGIVRPGPSRQARTAPGAVPDPSKGCLDRHVSIVNALLGARPNTRQCLRPSWRPIYALIVLLLMSSCKFNSTDKSRVKPVVEQQVGQSLPGETPDATFQRLFNLCMDSHSETNFQILPDGSGGTIRGYDTADPRSQANFTECQKGAELIAAPKSTASDLEVGYVLASRVVQCLRDAGFDMGILVAKEQFLSEGGQATLASRWDQAAQQFGFDVHLYRCDLANRSLSS